MKKRVSILLVSISLIFPGCAELLTSIIPPYIEYDLVITERNGIPSKEKNAAFILRSQILTNAQYYKQKEAIRKSIKKASIKNYVLVDKSSAIPSVDYVVYIDINIYSVKQRSTKDTTKEIFVNQSVTLIDNKTNNILVKASGDSRGSAAGGYSIYRTAAELFIALLERMYSKEPVGTMVTIKPLSGETKISGSSESKQVDTKAESISPPSSPATKTESPIAERGSKNRLITIKNSNIRTEPATKSKIIITVKKGTKLKEISKSGDWLKVQLESGKIGYIYKTLVKEFN